jgi:hypothetical protein
VRRGALALAALSLGLESFPATEIHCGPRGSWEPWREEPKPARKRRNPKRATQKAQRNARKTNRKHRK